MLIPPNKTFKTERRRLAMTFAALLAVAVGLAACGNSDSKPSASGNGTDLAFVEDMVPHHQSAIEMATIALSRGQSEFVKRLAADIVNAQEQEITVMRMAKARLIKDGIKKTDLGIPPHQMGMDTNSAELKTAKPFDKAFIDMMVPHHQGAIRIARVEVAYGESGKLKKLAAEIIAAQTREILAMNRHRTQQFGGPSPAGGVPIAQSNQSSHEPGGMNGMSHGG